jgi:hypothetical protein
LIIFKKPCSELVSGRGFLILNATKLELRGSWRGFNFDVTKLELRGYWRGFSFDATKQELRGY